MKINLFITILLIITSFQQDKIAGKYRDNFGSEFTFKSDSTYEYNAASHFTGFWSKGKWKVNNDTIFFKAVPSYDTLRIVGRRDSLILSRTKTPQLISANSIKEIFWPKSSGIQDVYSGKLFFQDNRLYEIKNNGKLITKKKTRSDRIDGENLTRGIQKYPNKTYAKQRLCYHNDIKTKKHKIHNEFCAFLFINLKIFNSN